MYNAVIYNIHTGKVAGYFNTLRGAKSSLTRLLKKLSTPEALLNDVDSRRAVSIADYAKTGAKTANEMVEVISIMGNKTVKIRRADVGGCCDPSTETYWSM
jgi:hypothetical protein